MQRPGPRTSVIGVEGELGDGNQFFIKGDETVDVGLSMAKGSRANLNKLYVEGANTGVDNEGELEAPESDIR